MVFAFVVLPIGYINSQCYLFLTVSFHLSECKLPEIKNGLCFVDFVL